jgi:hypothetical protein
MNGTKWIYPKKYLGSPMLLENYWPKADIVYNGIHFGGVMMNYDVYNNEIIVFHRETGKEKYVVISRDKVSGFSFTDTVMNRKHVYENIELPGIRGRTFYENASVGKISLYIKPMKSVEMRSSGGGQGTLSSFYEYYLNVGNGYAGFHSKSQFIKLLANHEPELNRYIRKNKLKINNRHPENVIAVVNYFNGFR